MENENACALRERHVPVAFHSIENLMGPLILETSNFSMTVVGTGRLQFTGETYITTGCDIYANDSCKIKNTHNFKLVREMIFTKMCPCVWITRWIKI